MKRPELSMVIACHYEEESIDEFYGRLRDTLDAIGRSYEILFVNDGSTDGTWAHLCAIQAQDPHVVAIDLFRNAGQACALTAGIERARGQLIGFMDSDLQLEPEDLPRLLARMDDDLDVVSGVRELRQDPWGRRVFSVLANKIVRRMIKHDLTDFGCTYKVYRGELLRAHGLSPENPLRQAYVLRSAGRYAEIPVTHHARRYGRSGWSAYRLFVLNLDHVLGASEGVFQWLSIFAFAIGALTLLRIVVSWFVPHSFLAAPVTTGLILNAMLLATAFVLGGLALLGEFVIRMYNRQQGGPHYVVRTSVPERRPEGTREAKGA